MVTIILGAVALGLLWGIMALGLYITYRILDIADLSVEGTITTGGGTAAILISNGMNPWLATLIAIFAGFAGGLMTGLLHTKLKIPALLSGILTMTALYSVNLRIMGKANIALPANGTKKVESVYTFMNELFTKLCGEYGEDDQLAWLFNILTDRNFAALIIGLCFVVVLGILTYWFFGTELGSAIRATGNNPKMVRAQGIHTSTMIIIGLVLSNGIVALSGALIAQYQGNADIQMGIGSIVIGLASIIIGEVIIGTKSFKRVLIAVPVGAIIYRIIIAMVMKLGMEANDLKLFTSLTVTLCLSLPLLKKFINKKIAKRNNGEGGVVGELSLEPVTNSIKNTAEETEEGTEPENEEV